MDKKIQEHFKKYDPILYQVILTIKNPFNSTASDNYFNSLCESIISQQLSVKAGDVIYKRFLNLVDNEVSPEKVIQLTQEQLRSIGISNAKAKYILDLAAKVVSNEVHLEKLKNMSEEEVISELIKVKGIGRWTAEMFLMFTLQRPDVFSTGDLGLKRAIERIYNISEPTEETLLEISAKWSPYRTFACRVLWHSLDNSPK